MASGHSAMLSVAMLGVMRPRYTLPPTLDCILKFEDGMMKIHHILT